MVTEGGLVEAEAKHARPSNTELNNVHVWFFYDSTSPSEPGPPHCRGFTITVSNTHNRRNPLKD